MAVTCCQLKVLGPVLELRNVERWKAFRFRKQFLKWGGCPGQWKGLEKAYRKENQRQSSCSILAIFLDTGVTNAPNGTPWSSPQGSAKWSKASCWRKMCSPSNWFYAMIRSTLILTQYYWKIVQTWLYINLGSSGVPYWGYIILGWWKHVELHGITIVFEVPAENHGSHHGALRAWDAWDPYVPNLCLRDLRTAARKALQPTKGMIDNDVAWASQVSQTLRLSIFQQTCWHQDAHKSAGYWNLYIQLHPYTLWLALAIWVSKPNSTHQSKVKKLKLSKEPPRLSACSLLAGWWNRYVQSSLQTYFMIMRSLILRCSSHQPHHQCGKETRRHHVKQELACRKASSHYLSG